MRGGVHLRPSAEADHTQIPDGRRWLISHREGRQQPGKNCSFQLRISGYSTWSGGRLTCVTNFGLSARALVEERLSNARPSAGSLDAMRWQPDAMQVEVVKAQVSTAPVVLLRADVDHADVGCGDGLGGPRGGRAGVPRCDSPSRRGAVEVLVERGLSRLQTHKA